MTGLSVRENEQEPQAERALEASRGGLFFLEISQSGWYCESEVTSA
jgi:hypothetical protein